MAADILWKGAAALRIEGELFWGDHEALAEALAKAASAPEDLVVDLSGTSFIFSSALALMISTADQVVEQGRRVSFIVPSRLSWVGEYLEQALPRGRFEIEVI